MQESMEMSGRVTIELSDASGRVIERQQRRNLIVTSGRTLVAQLFGGISGGTPPGKVSHMAVGTDATPPADEQTALLAERAPRKPIEVTYSEFDDLSSGVKVRRVRASLKAVFDFGEANGPAPLREAAVFTAPAAGVMYNRVVFDAVTKTSAFQLTLLWDISF